MYIRLICLTLICLLIGCFALNEDCTMVLYRLILQIVQQEVLGGLRVPFTQKLALLAITCAS